MRTHVLGAAVLVLVVGTGGVHAGIPEPPVRGERVRLTAPALGDQPLRGWLVGETADGYELRLEEHGGRTLFVPRTQIAGLEVGRGRRVWKGAGLGAAIGAGLMVGLIGLACTRDGECGEAIPYMVVYGGVTGLVGAGIGAGVGASRTRWRPVPIDRGRVTLSPVPGGAALDVRVGF